MLRRFFVLIIAIEFFDAMNKVDYKNAEALQ